MAHGSRFQIAGSEGRKVGSGGRIRTYDQRINSPLRYRCATPEYRHAIRTGPVTLCPPSYARQGAGLGVRWEPYNTGFAGCKSLYFKARGCCSLVRCSAMEQPSRLRRAPDGLVAEWLRRGLQILAPRFDSGRGLHLFL